MLTKGQALHGKKILVQLVALLNQEIGGKDLKELL